MKYLLMIIMSILMLTACGTAEEGTDEEISEAADEESDEKALEEDTENARETEPEDIEPASNVDFSVKEKALTDTEGSEMTSMLEMNSELAEMMSGASESDADAGDILMLADDLTTYYSEAFVAIHVFQGDSGEPSQSDVEGMNAEVDERDHTEAYSKYYNTETGEFEEYLYRDEDGYYIFDDTKWTDTDELSPDEDIYYGRYTNLYDAFMETENIINVSEDEEYYYIHNIGTEAVLHETFGNIFNVEYTGADESEMENAVVASVDKSTGEMDELLYITTAPAAQSDEYLHIELAVSFEGYGAFDDEGVTAPAAEETGAAGGGSSNIGRAPDSVDFSLTEEQFSEEDGMEMTSMLAMNSPVPSMLDNAEQTDAAIEDILKTKEEVTTYYGETFMTIDVFDSADSEPLQSDTVGLIAEMDEEVGMEVYSEIHDPASDEFIPHHYGNPDSVFAYQDGMWTEDPSSEAEEIFHATYSSLYDAFIDTEDVIEILEDDEYYYLYDIGDEMILHDVFGDMFEVEYTGADEEAMENGVVGIVNKEDGTFAHLAYISTAPALHGNEYLHIEVAASYGDYGAYDDDGITVPDIYE